MKNKLLLALASLFIGLTSIAASGAYAATASGMPTQTQSAFCANESTAFEPNCAGNLTEREGKAAYGEPREVKMESTTQRAHFCSAEGPTILDAKC
ncbi:MAG: hypothetical protein ABIG70_13495 [Pseudomonadota bacterium]|nr:hypothetical protein [Gammaproteobacteria bacterium]MBU1731491.1 hypothetical protein [Gammaproteobacteria bacterium]MBU1892996.1 hypothetical protein [Gammaproteobacteria bacterium]